MTKMQVDEVILHIDFDMYNRHTNLINKEVNIVGCKYNSLSRMSGKKNN